MTQTFQRSKNILFMNHWKAVGAFVRPNSITDYSNDP